MEEQAPRDELTVDMFADGEARPRALPIIQQHVDPSATQEERLGEGQYWGVFDQSDFAFDNPRPAALFETEEEARGYVLLTNLEAAEPVIRKCTVRGTVTLTSEDVKEVLHGGGGNQRTAEEKLQRLVRALEESGRLAAELAEQLQPATRADVMSFSVDLFNSATELRELVPLISAAEAPHG